MKTLLSCEFNIDTGCVERLEMDPAGAALTHSPDGHSPTVKCCQGRRRRS